MKKVTEKSSIELIEEATHLLRLAPSRVLVSYYLGTFPFVLGLLYFWSDMSRSAFAQTRLPEAALGMALLFAWTKTWQAVFTHQLLARLSGESQPRWGFAKLARLTLAQAIVQPSGLFVLPVALVLTAPFGWLYAFYQNVTVLAGDTDARVGVLLKKAWRQACLWPGQNHAVLMLLPLFGLVVCLNLVVAVLAVPAALDTFLDVQTPFAQSPWAIFNSTFMAAVFGLAFLCLDPLLKAVYVLRCFYGESLKSAADLKAELRILSAPPTLGVAALVLLLGLAASPPVTAADLAEEASPVAAPSRVAPRPLLFSPPDLDRSVDRVMEQREFLWRLPRDKAPADKRDSGFLSELLQAIGTSVKEAIKAVVGWIERAVNWLRSVFSPGFSPRPTPGDWFAPLPVLTILLILALVGLLLWLLWRMWHEHRRRAAGEVAAQPASPAPDLADENVGADQLPEDGWITLGRDLWQRGELRLALRAFYLSSLAHLADRNLIALAKFKSNLDYARELGRRAHALPDLLDVFAQNIFVFDRAWYGLHEVNSALLDQFARNVERMKTC
jgi:hypothetical protein